MRINTIENIHRIQSRHTLVIDEVAHSDPRRGVATAVGKVATTMGRLAYSELERSGVKTLWKASVGCPTYSERDLVEKLLSRSGKS